MRYNNLEFSKNSGAYLRTTENINGYYNKLNFLGKKVLTVVGSGDQIFEAILRGAKEVEGFDISENAILLYYLKEAAIKTMNFEQYMNFFFVESKCFTKEGYEILRPELSEKVKQFWDRVFYSKEREPLDYINAMLVAKPAFYMTPTGASMKLSKLSSYLEETNYYKLQSQMKDGKGKIKICLRDIKDIDQVNDSYDYIILSNIFEYQDTDEFKELISQYHTHLNTEELMVIGYAYHDIDVSYYSEFDKTAIPSRYALNGGYYDAPDDYIITTRKKINK